MKLTYAFLALIVAFGFSACAVKPSKQINLSACCATGSPDKEAVLVDSWAPEGRVIRIAH